MTPIQTALKEIEEQVGDNVNNTMHAVKASLWIAENWKGEAEEKKYLIIAAAILTRLIAEIEN